MAAIVAVLALATSPVAAQLLPADPAVDPAAVQPSAPVDPAPSAVPLPTPEFPTQPQVAQPSQQPQAAEPAQVIVPPPSAATEVAQPLPPEPELSEPASEPAPAASAVTSRAPAETPVETGPVREAPAALAQASDASETADMPASEAPALPPLANQEGVDLTPLAGGDTAETPVAPAVEAQPAQTQGALWAIGGGVLLLGAGFGTFLATRRKRPAGPMERAPAPKAAPVPERTVPERTVNVTPAVQTVAPLAPGASRFDVPAQGVIGDRLRVLEAMVAAPPSPENPFLTRKARLRRANHILSRGVPEPLRGDAQSTRAPASAPQPQVTTQPVYGFGKAQAPRRRDLTPVTS